MRSGNLAILPGGQGFLRVAELPEPARAVGASVRVAMIRTPINPDDLPALDGRYAFDLDRDAARGWRAWPASRRWGRVLLDPTARISGM